MSFVKLSSFQKWCEISGHIAPEQCHRVRLCILSNVIAEATAGLNFSLEVFDDLKSIDIALFVQKETCFRSSQRST